MYITKNTSIMTLHKTCGAQDICNVEWEKTDQTPKVTCPEANRQHKDLLPTMPECNFQIKPDKKD